jgi:NAD(P)H-quinone oxidoreductase subunit 5
VSEVLYTLPYVSPLLLGAVALVAFGGAARGSAWQRATARLAEAGGASALCFAIAVLGTLLTKGTGTSPLLGVAGFGLSARTDALSVTLLLLVSSVGWVVLRYSKHYLDGEPGHGRFTGWICLTIAAVLVLVQAGNLVQLTLAWVATSLSLHRLLLFYPQRVEAARAARKKYVVARLSDTALIGAAVLIGAAFGTGDIGTILAAANQGAREFIVPACALLGLAAILKSAQFPAHGWLTEVVETPTPVSALLHAGLINAGGFVLIRFAELMLLAPGVLAVLVMIGGFTSLFGGLVMLTQPAVKTSLAWSTIAQMGFMIFQCGLALFPLALLHIVAHSLYKAHAFLSSGNAVELVAAQRRPGPVATPGVGAVARAFLIAVGIYLIIGLLFGLHTKSPQAIALGGILILGVAYLLAQGFADAAPRALTRRTVTYALLASVSYFTLHGVAAWLMRDTLPATPAPGPLEWALMVLSLLSFAAVAVAQATFPLWAGHPAARDLRVHVANGFYANAVFDRVLGSWSSNRSLVNTETKTS